MKNELITTALKKVPSAVATTYLAHEGTILPAVSIGASGAAIIFSVKNSNDILNIIADAKEILKHEENPEIRKKIYLDVGKELAPKVAPIAGFYGLSIFCTLLNKKHTDKKIADLTAAVGLAQSAITQYQLWQKEAEKELGKEKADDISKAVIKDTIDKNPETKENTVGNTKPFANESWRYWDDNGQRYIYSDKSPNDITRWKLEASQDLFNGNWDDDRICINEFYDFLARDIQIPSFTYDKLMYWYATDNRGQMDPDLVDIELYTMTDSDGKAVNAFHCNFLPYR